LKIPIEKIVVSKDNPRQSFDEEGLRRLGESIKEHGQLQSVIVRPRGSGYELVVGERRLRACVLVGLSQIEADVKNVDDLTAMELRLIENTQREDLSDAEKGDAVLALWVNYDKFETLKDVANAIEANYDTVLYHWVRSSKKISPKLRDASASKQLTNEHIHQLIKYPHSVQNKLAKIIINRGISSHKEVLRRFTKLYDENPNADLNILADKVLGIETVTIPKNELSKKVLDAYEEKREEQKQLAKIQRMQKKPSKPLNKETARKHLEKKSDFKFVKARVSHGKAGLLPPLKTEVKPTILPNPINPDYSLCKCALCPLFATHCKGRCWT